MSVIQLFHFVDCTSYVIFFVNKLLEPKVAKVLTYVKRNVVIFNTPSDPTISLKLNRNRNSIFIPSQHIRMYILGVY